MAWTIPCASSLDTSVERLRTPDRFKQKEDLIAEMLDCLKKLNGVDQVILGCWMVYPKGEYTDMAIEELGWDNNKRTRNVVNVRCNRAIAMLGNMMGDYRIVYISANCERVRDSSNSGPKVKSALDYNFIRRRQRAAKKAITSRLDSASLAKNLACKLGY